MKKRTRWLTRSFAKTRRDPFYNLRVNPVAGFVTLKSVEHLQQAPVRAGLVVF